MTWSNGATGRAAKAARAMASFNCELTAGCFTRTDSLAEPLGLRHWGLSAPAHLSKSSQQSAEIASGHESANYHVLNEFLLDACDAAAAADLERHPQ